jgi:hypothetical protein
MRGGSGRWHAGVARRARDACEDRRVYGRRRDGAGGLEGGCTVPEGGYSSCSACCDGELVTLCLQAALRRLCLAQLLLRCRGFAA